MASLKTKKKIIFRAAGVNKTISEFSNIIVQNESNGNGDYIHTWNVSGLNKPTDESVK